MLQADEHILWRARFVSALELLAAAGARMPFGVADPILCGSSAMELYTGSLWPVGDLEVIASDARALTAQLFAVGFRWSDRPRQVERGPWHPEFEIGIDIIEDREAPCAAEEMNRLVVVLDQAPSARIATVSLKIVGIEDLIIQQVRYWLRDGAALGDSAARVQALIDLGREGICGPLDVGYLQGSVSTRASKYRRLGGDRNSSSSLQHIQYCRGMAEKVKPLMGGGQFLIGTAAGTHEVAQFIVGSAESAGRSWALESAHGAVAALHATLVLFQPVITGHGLG